MKIADQLGISQSNDVLKALRAKTPEEIIRVSKPVPGLFGEGIKFGPIVDGWALPEDPESAWIRGKMADVPFMVGANADEGTIFLPGLPVNDVKGYEDWVKLIIPERPQEILKLFPARTNEEVKPALNKLIGVSAFIAPARTMARLASKGSSKVFLYHFTRVAPLPALQKLGAFHAAEISLRLWKSWTGIVQGADRQRPFGEDEALLDQFRQDRRSQWNRPSGLACLSEG